MKQSINFYQDEFRKPEIKLSARQLLQAIAGVLLLVTIAGVYQYWLVGDLSHSIEQATTENTLLENSIAERKKALELVKTDPKLEVKLAQLKTKNIDKRRLASYINKMGLDSGNSVTEYYKALSENEISGIWLSKIILYKNASDIGLEGMTRNASDVSIYIEKMKDKPVFGGVSFHMIKLKKSEELPLYTEFYIDSRSHKDEG